MACYLMGVCRTSQQQQQQGLIKRVGMGMGWDGPGRRRLFRLYERRIPGQTCKVICREWGGGIQRNYGRLLRQRQSVALDPQAAKYWEVIIVIALDKLPKGKIVINGSIMHGLSHAMGIMKTLEGVIAV